MIRTTLRGHLSLLSVANITLGGQTFTADSTKAYFDFTLSHGFPVITSDRTAIHPAVVQRSYLSMLHQVLNLGHAMRAYDPETIPRDRILGCVVAVEYPPMPYGGWKLQSDPEKTPGIRGVAVVYKKAEGAATILGQHLGGRQTWTVSMETLYDLSDSGLLVGLNDPLGKDMAGPEDARAIGWGYSTFDAAPAALLDAWDMDKSIIKRSYSKRPVVALLGGLAGTVHYAGVGLTRMGKEPTASIGQFLASEAEEALREDEEGIELAHAGLDLLEKTFNVSVVHTATEE